MVTSQPAASEPRIPERPSPSDFASFRRIPRNLVAAAAVLLSVFVWAYWSTFVELVHIWDSSPDYSHGYLVIPLAAWFLWRRRVPRSLTIDSIRVGGSVADRPRGRPADGGGPVLFPGV